MPLYVADYLADTAYLTTEQHGAYLLMLMAYWRNGPIPNDPRVIASITKISPDAWSIAQAVLEQFFTLHNGMWVNKRIEQEMQTAKNKKKAAQEKALRAAQARWGNASRNAPSNAQAMLEHMPQQCPSPSPSPTKEKNPPTPRKRGNAVGTEFDLFWSAYPKKVAKPNAVKAWAKVSAADHAAILAALKPERWPGHWHDNSGRYIPNPATWLNARRWEDEQTTVAPDRANNWGCPEGTHPLELPKDDPRRIAFDNRRVVV